MSSLYCIKLHRIASKAIFSSDFSTRFNAFFPYGDEIFLHQPSININIQKMRNFYVNTFEKILHKIMEKLF